MKALDTNVLIRFLVGDDRMMMEKSQRLMEKAELEGERLLVTSPVILEVLWVLGSGYGYARPDILDAMERLMALSVLEFEHVDLMASLISQGRSKSLGLADLLIGLSGKTKGCKATMTFDRKASSTDLFEIVP
ncbi:MAG: type II toxin-antitoxin system VapC family toxin [Candidatus Sumerlaeota bacterium]|nr:type II toxin-antitoxin system VapC family toxin [Candidatus Sumerlaeota bacterium]